MTNGLVKEGQFKAVPPSVSLGKEIRTHKLKNSVANHYSHCLDSPLLVSQAFSLEADLLLADLAQG